VPVTPQALCLGPAHTSLNSRARLCPSVCANFVPQAAAARKAAKRAAAENPGDQSEGQEVEQEKEDVESEDERCASDHRFVYMGPRGSWTALHADVLRSFSWSFNVCGRKRWLLFPPKQVPLPQPAMPLLHHFPAYGLPPTAVFMPVVHMGIQRSLSEDESQSVYHDSLLCTQAGSQRPYAKRRCNVGMRRLSRGGGRRSFWLEDRAAPRQRRSDGQSTSPLMCEIRSPMGSSVL
jgi:hypothetical protein